jgi:hypothetical protein
MRQLVQVDVLGEGQPERRLAALFVTGGRHP